MSLPMYPLLNMKATSIIPIWETLFMEDTNIGDFFLLDLPQSIYKPSQSQSQSSASELVSKHSQIPESTSPNLRNPPSRKQVPSSTRPTLVYSRKKATIIELVQVQELELTTSCKVNDSSSPKISNDSVDINDLNLPIAVTKGTRTCTQHPLYPLSHFMSYENCHHLIKIFSPT